MTEVSKEAVTLAKTIASDIFHGNKPIEEIAAMIEGFTIAPIAPVTDEKLREAMNVLRRRCDPNSAYMSGPSPIQAAYLTITDALSELAQRRAEQTWQQIDKWHEDIGPCFWAKFPVDEPYYAGSPLDTDWPDYHTHFIPMSVFNHLLDSMGMPLPTPPKED